MAGSCDAHLLDDLRDGSEDAASGDFLHVGGDLHDLSLLQCDVSFMIITTLS